MALPSSFFPIFLCWLVIGSGGRAGDGPDYVSGDRNFYRGNNSLIGNIMSSLAVNTTFPGFNFSGDPAIPGSGVSRNKWSWVVNVTDIEVGGGSIVSQTTHTLRFPEQTFPNQNATDWTVCAYPLLDDFLRNLSSRAKTNDGSCSEVLGDACLAELTRGMQDSSPNRPKFPLRDCPLPPFWFQLPECRNRIGLGIDMRPRMFFLSEPSPSSTISPLMLTVPPALMNINNGSFDDPWNTASLHSNEVYWSERSAVHPKSDSWLFEEQADREQFMMLTFAPSNKWIWTHYGFPLNNTIVLPMCLRASGRNHVSEPAMCPAESGAALGAQLVLQ